MVMDANEQIKGDKEAEMISIDAKKYNHIVFFTGAGMSAESGVPTYHGQGGIWSQYNWEDYACQTAFENDPQKVLEFHEVRRRAVLSCNPHAGHQTIADLERSHPQVTVVTQNIDGMHHRAGSQRVIELHGSLWRLRCGCQDPREDTGENFKSYRCGSCGEWLRPDIIWFGDALKPEVVAAAISAIGACDLFISVGTSGVVWPAAGFPEHATQAGARCVEINPEATEFSGIYDDTIREPAGSALPALFGQV